MFVCKQIIFNIVITLMDSFLQLLPLHEVNTWRQSQKSLSKGDCNLELEFRGSESISLGFWCFWLLEADGNAVCKFKFGSDWVCLGSSIKSKEISWKTKGFFCRLLMVFILAKVMVHGFQCHFWGLASSQVESVGIITRMQRSICQLWCTSWAHLWWTSKSVILSLLTQKCLPCL